MKNNNKGFTLIELIMVTIILGILAAVAVPRYMTSVASAEAAAEDAVISSINAGLESHATDMLISTGRAYWPDNPFDALKTKPAGYDASDSDNAILMESGHTIPQLSRSPIRDKTIPNILGPMIKEQMMMLLVMQ